MPSDHSASIKTVNRPTTHCRGRGSYGRVFRLGCIAPPFIIAPLPRPPTPRALPLLPPPRLPRHHPDVLPGYEMMQPRVDRPGHNRSVARQHEPLRHPSLLSGCLQRIRATIHPDTTANPPTRPHHRDFTARRLMLPLSTLLFNRYSFAMSAERQCCKVDRC